MCVCVCMRVCVCVNADADLFIYFLHLETHSMFLLQGSISFKCFIMQNNRMRVNPSLTPQSRNSHISQKQLR